MMSTTSTNQLNTIEKLRGAAEPFLAMLAGIQLDLFTPLKDGPMSAEQMADALGVHPAKLQLLLYALAAAGLVTVKDGYFYNTAEAAHFLVRGSPGYVGDRQDYATPRRWSALLRTAESIRAGAAQAKIDFSALPLEESESFARNRHAETLAAARDLVARYDFSSCRNLLDVGGGSGGLAIAVTQAHPHLQATVVDLPTVTPVTRRLIDEAGAADRIRVVTADVVSEPLTGSFDVAVLKNFIQVLSADRAGCALRNVSSVLEPGGMVYILGSILDNSRLSPLEAAMINVYFLNIYDGGQAYTEQEYQNWLTEAGFEGFKRVVLPNGTSILTAGKPG